MDSEIRIWFNISEAERKGKKISDDIGKFKRAYLWTTPKTVIQPKIKRWLE